MEICFEVLDNSPAALKNPVMDITKRADPVYVSRTITAMVRQRSGCPINVSLSILINYCSLHTKVHSQSIDNALYIAVDENINESGKIIYTHSSCTEFLLVRITLWAKKMPDSITEGKVLTGQMHVSVTAGKFKR